MTPKQLSAILGAIYDNSPVSFGDMVAGLAELARERCLFQSAQELRVIADRIEAGDPDSGRIHRQ